MRKRILGIFIFSILAGLISSQVQATHLRAGEIHIKAKPGSPGTFIITIHAWVNSGSTIKFGGTSGLDDILQFGDGSSMLVPETESIPRPDLGVGIGEIIFTVEHAYPSGGFYVVSYREPNRNEGVLNMDGSVTTRFYIESGFLYDPFTAGNSGPVLLVPPVDRGCSGQLFFHAPQGVDENSDSLSYSIVIPKSNQGLNVQSYLYPNNQYFYSDFNTGNEAGNGQPTYSIDPITGVLAWDAPDAVGEYSVAIKVTEWRKTGDCTYMSIGFVIRDMQILIDDCNNLRPKIIIPNDTCVVSGTTLSIPVIGTDPENHPVRIQAYSEIFLNGTATFSPTTFQPSSPNALATLNWTPTCENAREQYYQISFRISDDPSPGLPLQTYAVWRVKVIPPPPTFEELTLDLSNRSAKISWNLDVCKDVATIQIWRRAAEIPYTPSACETGMPSLGYALIAERPATDDSFVDTNNGKGLQDGVRYCYRLLGVINNSCGAASLVSMDTCLAPILVEAPIITNVSVMKTNTEQGAIFLKWQSPYDRDLTQGSLPYQYEVYRSEGFEEDTNISKIYEGPLADTSWLDQGINSKALVFNYRIVLSWKQINQQSIPIDTSSVVSSVRLEGIEADGSNTLQWAASVPWSNALGPMGRHLIYRGVGLTEDNLELIDSVDVFVNGFQYKDEGKFNNLPLNPDVVYAYKIETLGSYGNPKIVSPLRNFSQVIWLQPTTEVDVCPPLVQIEGPSCNDGSSEWCDKNEFTNKLSWVKGSGACRADITSYNIYAATEVGGNFVLVGNTVESVYYDSLLPSPARCYKITAVNQHGVESVFSNEVCNDNCLYYELPNVFTPNGDGCNDTFSAFGKRVDAGEECMVVDGSRCARFVNHVSITIFNRWGKEVYAYQSAPDGNMYVDWDGSDSKGEKLSAGTYYFTAIVRFVTIDPSKREQTIKGWVQLLR